MTAEPSINVTFGPRRAEIFADIPKFTDAQAAVQINDFPEDAGARPA